MRAAGDDEEILKQYNEWLSAGGNRWFAAIAPEKRSRCGTRGMPGRSLLSGVRGGVPFKKDVGLDLHGNLQRYDVAAEAAGSTSTTGSGETAGSIKGVLIAN